MGRASREGPVGEALALFVAPRNLEYLRGAGAALRGGAAELRSFAAGRGGAALRGAPLPPRDAWEGVRFLNRGFLEAEARAAEAEAAEAEAAEAEAAEGAGGAEPYHVRAFEADSLALPGGGGARARGGAEQARAHGGGGAWEEGRAGRSAEEAWAEYYGEDWAATGVRGAKGGPGRARAGLAPGHDRWARPIPPWQRASKGPAPEAGFPRARENEGAARGWAPPGGRAWELRR